MINLTEVMRVADINKRLDEIKRDVFNGITEFPTIRLFRASATEDQLHEFSELIAEKKALEEIIYSVNLGGDDD